MRAVLLRLFAVLELHILREIVGVLRERLVEVEHFGAVFRLRLVLRRGAEDAKLAGAPLLGDLPAIDLPLQAAIDRVTRPMRRAERPVGRIHAGDAGDEDVSMRKVGLIGQDQGGYGACRVGIAHRSRHQAQPLGIAKEIGKGLGKPGDRDPGGELLVLDPALRFPRRVAWHLEHRDDENLGRDPGRFVLCRRRLDCPKAGG